MAVVSVRGRVRSRQARTIASVCASVCNEWPVARPAQPALLVLAPLFLCFLALALVPFPTHAQSRETYIGTFGARSPESGERDRAFRAPPSRRSQESDAHRFLQDARDDLSVGNILAARSQLEMIVRRYPDTDAGREAAQILNRMSVMPPDRAGGRATEGPSSGEPLARAPSAPPAARAAPRDPQAMAEARAARLTLDLRMTAGDRVFFANGSAELGARARQVLAAQASWLARHPDAALTIEGHADDDGPASANQDIARRRGEAVALRLVDEGVPAERIRVVGHGRDRRIATCPGYECAAQNRRVVTAVTTLSSVPSRGDTPGRSSPRF